MPAEAPDIKRARDVGFRSNLTWTSTGVVMNFLERSLGVKLSTQGLENLTQHPTLYVVNHFTRAETFIIPYLLHKIRKETARSLAHHSLFETPLGPYISRLGAVSTQEPHRNRMIIGDLMTGRKNWVIYPEGLMVKNKKTLERGRFMLQTPDYAGPPRTGAAVLAIHAQLYKQDYLEACERHDLRRMEFYQERYGFHGPDELARRDLLITPINITYYPIRPRENKVSQLARSLFKDLPQSIAEELKIEGRILLGKTDMDVYFCPPIRLSDYLQPRGLVRRLISHFQSPDQRIDATLRSQKQALTNQFMGSIYRSLHVNFDHLFCYGLLSSKERVVSKRSFHNALLNAALEFDRRRQCRLHHSLTKQCAKIAFGLSYEPLENIVSECKREGILEEIDNYYVIHREAFDDTIPFHDIRLRLTAKVIANEFEPLVDCVETLQSNLNLPPDKAKIKLADEIARYEQRHYERDYFRYFDQEQSKEARIGQPFDLRPVDTPAKAGIVLVHGYLAAPEEMRALGERLRATGYHCYGVRLDGHGTAPRNLADVNWTDWMLSLTAAYALLRNLNEKVYIVGFSMGGLLSLLKAADLGTQADGLVTINTALRIKDNRASFAGAAVIWNELLKNLNIESGRLDYVENKPFNPHINYRQNYLKGVKQLSLVIERCEKRLSQVSCPTLILQSDADPIVRPQSAQVIHKKIASSIKELHVLESSRHHIVNDESLDRVTELIVDFLTRLSRDEQGQHIEPASA